MASWITREPNRVPYSLNLMSQNTNTGRLRDGSPVLSPAALRKAQPPRPLLPHIQREQALRPMRLCRRRRAVGLVRRHLHRTLAGVHTAPKAVGLDGPRDVPERCSVPRYRGDHQFAAGLCARRVGHLDSEVATDEDLGETQAVCDFWTGWFVSLHQDLHALPYLPHGVSQRCPRKQN